MKKALAITIASLLISMAATSQNVVWSIGGTMFADPYSTVKIPVNAGFSMTVGAISLTIGYDPSQIEIVDVMVGWGAGYAAYQVYPTFIRVGWFAPPFLPLSSGSVMLCVKAKTKNISVTTLSLVADPDNEIADQWFNTIPACQLITPKVATNKYTD